MSEQDVSSVASEAAKPVEAPFQGGEQWDDGGIATLNAEVRIKDVEDESMSG